MNKAEELFITCMAIADIERLRAINAEMAKELEELMAENVELLEQGE